MSKIIELRQTVARGYPTTWNIPHISDGDMWRNIENVHLVENPHHINGHDLYEDAIFRLETFLKQKGWKTEITDTKKPCHEHLYYQQFTLRCWKAE